MEWYVFKKGLPGVEAYAKAGGWDSAQDLLAEMKEAAVDLSNIDNEYMNSASDEPVQTEEPDLSHPVSVMQHVNCGVRRFAGKTYPMWYSNPVNGYLQSNGDVWVNYDEFEKACL